MEKDILGRALLDYQNGNYVEDIVTYSSLDEKDALPLPYLFRNYHKMPILEQKALGLCHGAILDIGCGAGGHSLYLQEKGWQVTALDRSAGAIEVCKRRGITETVHDTLLNFTGGRFDTLLLLMNGIGIAGKLNRLDSYLEKLKSLLKPNGQILLDSSDIIYMYDSDEDGGHWIPEGMDYYGEVTFTMEYKGLRSEPFNWLYVDYNTLQRAADYHGLHCELVSQGEHYDYLTRLSLK
ncbi:class I SAM-dependent methyltransferase [Maribacter sp. 2304DJ31-5]|uniref:class I SAM-dependent methyltransferase n=1 Tax=Maribacter sp. 2304DJ31-5 TaxID=3386273 RepID=UPI0039BCD4FC